MSGMELIWNKRAVALLAVILAVVSAGLTSRVMAADLYVAPQGDDGWSGQLPTINEARNDGPLATLSAALDRARSLRAAQPQRNKPIVIQLRGGRYELTKPIELTPADSGTASSPLIIEAHPAESPILSGGSAITDWKVGEDGRWRTMIPQVKSGTFHFTHLIVDDQRRDRTRLPKKGYYRIADALPPSPAAQNRGFDQFVYAGDELRSDWTNLSHVEVQTIHIWSASRLPIRAMDPAKKVVQFAGRTRGMANWMTLGKNHRYVVWNVREALSEPGEWYLDRPTGELTYIPRTGESPQKTQVIMPRLEQLLLIRGDLASGKFVEHVTFKGITFAHANWMMPAEGLSLPQGEINVQSAVELTGAKHLAFERCAIRHVGGYAVTFGAGCRDSRLESCELFDLGGGGVKIGTASSSVGWGPQDKAIASPGKDESLITQHITVRDCTIAHGGRLHPAALGIWIGDAHHNTIEHNDIFDFYYTAISVGWVWGYRPSAATHNRIEFNHIHTIGRGVLSDMGGVYTLGVSPGTSVSHNVIHDIHAFDYGGWGLYTDEGSTGIVMRDNLVYRTKTGGFHQHYGKENLITNNIFAFSIIDQIQRSRVEEHLTFTFKHNIVIHDRGNLLGKNWADKNVKLDENLYWHTGGADAVKFPGNRTLDQWRQASGHDAKSIVADPLFIDVTKDDFRLKDGSPATQVGFKPFDFTKAGRLTKPTMTLKLPEVSATFD